MLKRIAATTALAAVVAVLSSCAPAGGPPTPTPPPTPSGPQGSGPENGGLKTGPLGSQDQAVAAAKHDLAQKKGISEESITVGEVTPVDWPDTSLGCPEPGKVYAQIIIPGYKIILSANGEQYEYHSDSSGSLVVTCTGK